MTIEHSANHKSNEAVRIQIKKVENSLKSSSGNRISLCLRSMLTVGGGGARRKGNIRIKMATRDGKKNEGSRRAIKRGHGSC